MTPSDSWISIEHDRNSFRIIAKENAEASRSATVVVQLSGIEGTVQRSISVTQKGDDAPYVDLGLPSGTQWCAYNKGATKIGGNGSTFTGSQSEAYRCPSSAQVDELIGKCTWAYGTVGGITGYLATGPNGNNIFFPTTPTISMGGNAQKGMFIWVRGSASSESQYYLKYSSAYGAMKDMVAHKNQSKFSIREVR